MSEPARVSLWSPDCARLVPARTISLEHIGAHVSGRCGVALESLLGRDRRRDLARARRLFVLVAYHYAGWSLTEAAAFLGISAQAASQHAGKADPSERELARAIAEAMARGE